MKLTAFLSLIFIIPNLCWAQLENNSTLAAKQLPLPDSGVQIAPLAKIDMPDATRSKSLSYLQEQKTKPYVERDEPYAHYLLSLNMHANQEIKSFERIRNPYDTHLKRNLAEIQLAFPYEGIPSINPRNIIGFAPIDTWKKGWTGIKEFFIDPILGTCEFSKVNRVLDHGGVLIPAEYARYDINNKPNTQSITGNPHSGFLYTIDWYDDTFNNTLICAKNAYSNDTLNSLIAYAKQLDGNGTKNKQL